MKLLVKSMIIASIMAIMNTNISTASETTLNVVPAVTALDVDSTQHFTITRGMGVWSCAEGLPAASYLIDYCNDKLGLPLQLDSYDLWRVRYNTAFERHSTNHRSR